MHTRITPQIVILVFSITESLAVYDRLLSFGVLEKLIVKVPIQYAAGPSGAAARPAPPRQRRSRHESSALSAPPTPQAPERV